MRILEHDVAEWYALSFEPAPPAILITVSETVAESVHSFLSALPSVAACFPPDIRLPDFFPPKSARWGFGRAIHTRRHEDGRITWICPLPRVLCKRHDPALEEKGGQRGFAASASLQLLFEALNAFEGATGATRPQILTVHEMCLRNSAFYGAVLFATLSPTACEWIATVNPRGVELVGVEQSIACASAKMFGTTISKIKHDCRASVCPPNSAMIRCPGNACEISTDGSRDPLDGCGMALTPHNTDSPIQQLSLLAGLAALYEFFAKELDTPLQP